MLLEKLNCLCPFPGQRGDQEEAVIQQVEIFLPGCSPGLWIKLRNYNLAFKWEAGESFLTNLIRIQVLCHPGAYASINPDVCDVSPHKSAY